MKTPEIRVTDNRKEWTEKELQRLFPNGCHEHIQEIMFRENGGTASWIPFKWFKPRKLKRDYEVEQIFY